MQTIKYYYLILFWIVFIPLGNLIGQSTDNSENIVNNQIWLDFYPHFYVHEKLEYYGDLGYRTIFDDHSWQSIYIYMRPSVRYHISKLFEVHGGVGLFYIFNKGVADRFEVRPWQGIKLNWPRYERLKFYSYLRLEERIHFMTDNWKATFDFRLRLKLAGKLIIIKSSPINFWFISFYGEVFIPVFDNIDEFFSNRGRTGIGLGYNPSKEWQFSVVYNWQYSRSGPNDTLSLSDRIFRLVIRRLWNFKSVIKF